MCAEALGPADRSRCSRCGERLTTGRLADEPGAPAPARPLPILRCLAALFVVSTGALVVALLLPERPPWAGHPAAAPLFDPAALAALPAPVTSGVAAGERWVWVEDIGAGPGDALAQDVLAVDASGVRYDGGEVELDASGELWVEPGTGPRAWAFTPLPRPEDVLAVRREELEAGGRRFDCLVVQVRAFRSMMNDVQATCWIAMSGDAPTYPGLVRVECSNRGQVHTTFWLERIERPGR